MLWDDESKGLAQYLAYSKCSKRGSFYIAIVGIGRTRRHPDQRDYLSKIIEP